MTQFRMLNMDTLIKTIFCRRISLLAVNLLVVPPNLDLVVDQVGKLEVEAEVVDRRETSRMESK